MSDPDWVLSLPALLDEVWRRIESREGAARTPVLATASESGPEVRTLVLRHADRATGTLEFHADAASPKVTQARRRPRAAVLVWDPDAQLQSRFDVLVSVVSGETAGKVWANVPASARPRYGGILPGARLDAPAPAAEAGAMARFAVLRAYVSRVDVLHLGEQNRRAIFRAEDRFAGRWVAP